MNTDQASPNAQLSALLSRYPPEIVALAKECLIWLRSVIPCTHELVYDYPKSVVVSLGMSERGYEAIVALAISAREMRLYLDKSLPDPKGLLEGTGAKVRSLVIENVTDLEDEDIRALIKAAIQHSGAAPARTGSPTMIFKSASKKPAAKKTVAKRTKKVAPPKP